MGSFDFGYADKIGRASKGAILIPKHAVDFFQTDKIKVKRYDDYGHFIVDKDIFVDAYVIQGIVVKLAQGEEIPFTVEDIFFKTYDYSSALEKYRLAGIDDYHDHISYSGKGVTTTAKYPLKIVSAVKFTYEQIKTASASGQYSINRSLPPVVEMI